MIRLIQIRIKVYGENHAGISHSKMKSEVR